MARRPLQQSPSSGEVLASRYRISKSSLLGVGAAGSVYRGLDLTDNVPVAVKLFSDVDGEALEVFKQTIEVSEKVRKHAELLGASSAGRSFGRDVSCDNTLVLDELRKNLAGSEALTLSQLVAHLDISRCFVQILDYSKELSGAPGMDEDSGQIFVVYEMGGDTLEDVMKDMGTGPDGQMQAQDLLELLWSLVCITWGLHVCGFVHMDIKPSNIVKFSGQRTLGGMAAMQWKLVDLDGAVCAQTSMDATGFWSFTPQFMPPEVAKAITEKRKVETRASRKMDVWSVAMCAMQGIFQVPVLEPWMFEWERETGSHAKFYAWLSNYDAEPIIEGDMEKHIHDIDPGLCMILKRMLTRDPEKRPCIARCLTHPCFRKQRDRLWKADAGLMTFLEETQFENGPAETPLVKQLGRHKSSACAMM